MARGRALTLLLVFWLAGLGACPDAQQLEDPFRRFREADPAPVPLLPLESAWTLTLPTPPATGAAMDDARVYVPLRDATLLAIDRETGVPRWTSAAELSVPPLAWDGALFAGDAASVVALDPDTGMARWRAPLGGPLLAPLRVLHGRLLAVVEPGEVVALHPVNGGVLWRRPLGAATAHAPVAGDTGSLFVTLADSRLVALSIVDGQPLWEQTVPGSLSAPAVAPGRVYVGSTDNYLYAFDPADGDLEWRMRGGGDVIGATADHGMIYYVSLDNIVRASNQGNGNQRWRREAGTRPVLPPRAFGGVVIVAGLSPALTVFNATTGAPLGTVTVQGNLLGAPLIDETLPPFRVSVVTLTREGVLEARRPATLMFREPLPAARTALPGRPLAPEPRP